MKKRRTFIKLTGLSLLASYFNPLKTEASEVLSMTKKNVPLLTIATWKNLKAITAASQILKTNGEALDAVEKGAMQAEADPDDTSVGYGGFPDRDGHVTLDACIMDHLGNAGSVMFLESILHAVSVARKVMEKTPHVYLAGKGALDFALQEGFKSENLLTEKAQHALEQWQKSAKYSPKVNQERHDTIGILALDKKGRLSGACSTSGLAFKMHGRVGDSPMIGAGLFVDPLVGAATATGLGEAVIKKVGAFSIVEMMKRGVSPQRACELAIKRLLEIKTSEEFQVGYIAMNRKGEYGAYSLRPGFQYTIGRENSIEVFESESFYS
ncbi:MAG: N(4)-(beta-N-acetylglucosaminyl)-L-asparaginase [Bacteroidota bacterium]|nr:N(4)-(beta-N-acetylglucosaminyl)-L-asparaginase [Bacteroidota bacterium]